MYCQSVSEKTHEERVNSTVVWKTSQYCLTSETFLVKSSCVIEQSWACLLIRWYEWREVTLTITSVNLSSCWSFWPTTIQVIILSLVKPGRINIYIYWLFTGQMIIDFNKCVIWLFLYVHLSHTQAKKHIIRLWGYTKGKGTGKEANVSKKVFINKRKNRHKQCTLLEDVICKVIMKIKKEELV